MRRAPSLASPPPALRLPRARDRAAPPTVSSARERSPARLDAMGEPRAARLAREAARRKSAPETLAPCACPRRRRPRWRRCGTSPSCLPVISRRTRSAPWPARRPASSCLRRPIAGPVASPPESHVAAQRHRRAAGPPRRRAAVAVGPIAAGRRGPLPRARRRRRSDTDLISSTTPAHLGRGHARGAHRRAAVLRRSAREGAAPARAARAPPLQSRADSATANPGKARAPAPPFTGGRLLRRAAANSQKTPLEPFPGLKNEPPMVYPCF